MRGNKSAPKESDTTYNERLSIPPPIEVPDKNSLCVNVFAVYVRAVAVDIASVADGCMDGRTYDLRACSSGFSRF